MEPNTTTTASTIHGNIVFTKDFSEHSKVKPMYVGCQNIFKAQRSEMLEKYRCYVREYNKRINVLNKEVLDYNTRVLTFQYQNGLTKAANQIQDNFKAQYNRISTDEFNAMVEQRNSNGTLYLQKKKYNKVQKSTERYFAFLIYIYGIQMFKDNNDREKNSISTKRLIQKVRVNSKSLCKALIRNNEPLGCDEKTVRNHIKRMVEAGILFDYKFHGQNRGVSYYINDEIFTVYCSETQKTLCAEDQLFTILSRENLPHNIIDTSTKLEELNIIENVNNHSPIKVKVDEQLSHIVSLQEIQDQLPDHPQAKNSDEGKLGGAAEISPKFSDELRAVVLDPHDLATNLSMGMYDNFRNTLRKRIEHEVTSGNMDQEEFRELLLQVFIRMAAPLWKNLPKDRKVHVAAWRKAINLIMDTLLLTHNGKIPTKQVAIYYFDNLVWRLQQAKVYFRKHSEFNILYPSLYFDPTRTSSKSGGFAYTVNFLKSREERRQAKETQMERLKQQAAKRNQRYNAIELVKIMISKYVRSKITYDQLYDYVNNNAGIPQSIIDRIPDYIAKAYKN